MRRLALALLLSQVVVAPVARASADVAGELLNSARLWVDKKRDDLAILALEKLLKIDPAQVDALVMLGEIELRQQHNDQVAEILQQMQTSHPDSPATRQLAEAYRVSTTERKTLATIRMLFRAGRRPEAAEMMRQLFPQGNPGGELGLEYQQIMQAENKPVFPGQRMQPLTGNAVVAGPSVVAKVKTISDQASHFWDLLDAANLARDRQQWIKAEKLARSANRLFRNDPEALLVLGNIKLDQNQLSEAEKLYRRVLDAKANEDRALRGLVRIWSLQNRRQYGLNFIEAWLEQHPQSESGFAVPWASLLREQADALVASGEGQLAQRLLESHLPRLSTQVWLRFDLANLYRRQGFPELGRTLMNEGLVLAPDDLEMRYANGIYWSILGDDEAVLAAFQGIDNLKLSDGMKALLNKSEVRLRIQRAHNDYLAGKQQAVTLWLDEAEYRAANQQELGWEVARAWIANGDVERGLLLGQRLRKPADLDDSLRYGQLLESAKRDAALNALLAELPLAADKPEQTTALNDLRRRDLLRRARALAAEQRFNDAEQLLRQGRQAGLRDNPELMLLQADYLEQQGRYGEAGALYRQLAQADANLYPARIGEARTHHRLNDVDHDELKQQLLALDEQIPAGQPDWHLDVARLLAKLDAYPQASRIAESAVNTHAGDASLHMQAGRIEQDAKRYEWALHHFDSAKQLAQGDTPQRQSAQNAIDEIRQRRYGFATGGFDQRYLTGSSGMSRVSNDEYPLLVRWPHGYQGHFFTQLDYSNISAGKLNFKDYDHSVGLFGKTAAYGNGSQRLFADQSASGLDLGVGYESDDWRFDVGSSPQGYPVTYMVGGIKHTGSIGDGYYSLNLSRRPMTNSLLSYAGAHDVVTGEVWGGVRKNGADLYSGYDIGKLGLFLQGGAYYLDGEKVKTNTSLMGRTGGDWAWIDNRDMRLTTGLALMYLAYDNNQQNYTFGHGGYWSPQDYKSLSFPVQWTGRYQQLAYLLRAVPAYSMSRQDGADFYPTRPDLQSQALKTTLPAGYDAPYYAGSTTNSFGYTLTGMLEYQVQDQWYLGARLELARSPYYSPNFMTFYFRYDFEPSNKPIPFPPRPVKPYDRY